MSKVGTSCSYSIYDDAIPVYCSIVVTLSKSVLGIRFIAIDIKLLRSNSEFRVALNEITSRRFFSFEIYLPN